MQIKSAEFIVESKDKKYQIRFVSSEVLVISFETGSVLPVANDDRKWKPCATHAMDLVRMMTWEPAKSNQSKKRVRKTKPRLKIAK